MTSPFPSFGYMPRFPTGSPVSSYKLDQLGYELDLSALLCRVHRSSAGGIASLTDTVIPWQVEDEDTLGGGMWDPSAPTYMTMRTGGTYLFVTQHRWIDLNTAPYRQGLRGAYLTVDSTNPAGDACRGAATNYAACSRAGEGVTIQCTAIEQLDAGQRIYALCWQDSGSTVQALNSNYGGTWLSCYRLGLKTT